MRRTLWILAALLAIRLLPKALRRQAQALQLITLLFELTAAAANTSKTINVEQRTGNLETRVGNLEQGKIPNIQSGTVIGQLRAGVFTGVSGGTVTLTGGGVTLHCGALSQLDTETQTAFLSTLSQGASPGGNLALDPFSGPSFGSGERADYINATITRLNNIVNSLQNHNYLAP